jgi:hypothetical protein
LIVFCLIKLTDSDQPFISNPSNRVLGKMAGRNRAIDEFVEQLDDKLGKAREKVEQLRIRIETLEKALEVSSGASKKNVSELLDLESESLIRAESKVQELKFQLAGAQGARDATSTNANRTYVATKTRRISSSWRQILEHIGLSGEQGADLEDIIEFIRRSQFAIKDTAVRSQLSTYRRGGLVEGLGGGRYRITAEGAALLNQEEPET